jgi:septation ring formation regulator EzrA
MKTRRGAETNVGRRIADDVSVVVYEYLTSGSKHDIEKLHKLVDELDQYLKKIRQELDGLKKLGSAYIEAQTYLPHLRRALLPIKSFIENIDQNAQRFSR